MSRLKLLWAHLIHPGRALQTDGERGAVAVTVTVLLVSLIAMGALAVDIGRLAAMKAQLQNGADASALAVAQNCGKSSASCLINAQGLANTFTPANANAGNAVAHPVAISLSNRTAQVDTQTPAGGLATVLAKVMGRTSVDVHATATAEWDYPGPQGSFPFTLWNGCSDLSSTTSTGQWQAFVFKQNGQNPLLNCNNGAPANHAMPGGWGWLDESGTCRATVSAQWTVGQNPGNNAPNDCSATLSGWQTQISTGKYPQVLFPIFDSSTGQGQNAIFHIMGYATLEIQGWKFGGNGSNTYLDAVSSAMKAQCTTPNSNRCLVGRFITAELPSTPSDPGGGTDLGTYSVKLIR